MAKIVLDVASLEDAAGRLRALAHPMRIAIISLLEDNPRLNVTEIFTRLKLEQASASHHLNLMKKAGMLASKKEGKQTYYSLKNEAITKLLDCINKCGS